MAAWSDVGAVAVGGGIGVVGTYIGTRLQIASLKSDREAAKHAARVARVAEVLGPIRTLLIDINPLRLMFQQAQLVQNHWEKWLPLRERLEIAAVSEPSETLRDDMRELEVEIANLFARLTIMFSPQLQASAAAAGADRDYAEDAKQHHAKAEALTEAILRDLHGLTGGNLGATEPAEIGRESEVAIGADSQE